MGYLRFGLALIVALSHAGMWSDLLNATTAVQVFFIISGFYMALILDGAYKDRPLAFYANRALRLLPAYWIVAGVTVTVMMLTGSTWPIARMLRGELTDYFALFSAVTLIGQDIVFNYDPQHLVIPPAWSVGMEIYFYVAAPFLVRCRTDALLVAAGVLFLFSHNFYVAPFQLPFFILGIVFYRAGLRPISSRLDAFFGELSYPIYLVHYPILHVFEVRTQYALPLIAVSAVAVALLVRPIDRRRAAIREGTTSQGLAPHAEPRLNS